MTGTLATVLVQSSSTSTSIVVALVAEGGLAVRHAIPIVMGANIGTSVTNTLVSMGQVGDRVELQRAFAGATVHDMFNMLTVLVLLPTEWIVGTMQGEGGPLYWVSHWLTKLALHNDQRTETFTSPIKYVTKPVTDLVMKANKYVIYARSLEEPMPQIPASVNTTVCHGPNGGDLSLEDCSAYYCLSHDLSKNLKKISSGGYSELRHCDGRILDNGGAPCDAEETCLLDAGHFYEERVIEGRMIKGGFVKGAGDLAGGILGLLLSLLMLCGGLVALCKMLKVVFMGKAKKIIRHATTLNDYLAILIGCAMTFIVQSSSVVTSALTPLCGIGVIPLEKMLPLSVGANIGTTCTALLAAMVSLKFSAVQIALCHLFFNLFGTMIWFPIPLMRQAPIGAARLLGLYASHYRFVPGLYILVAFVLIPLVCLGISAIFNISFVGGIVAAVLALLILGVFEYLWCVGYPSGQPWCYRVLSREARAEGERELAAANAVIQGEQSESSEPADVGAKV